MTETTTNVTVWMLRVHKHGIQVLIIRKDETDMDRELWKRKDEGWMFSWESKQTHHYESLFHLQVALMAFTMPKMGGNHLAYINSDIEGIDTDEINFSADRY